MAPKPCPFCKTTKYLETNLSAGQIVCQECGTIVDENILVSEVGFNETSGGRITVQGTFVSHHQTGIAGFRSGAGAQSSERVKSEGAAKIKQLGLKMGVPFQIYNSASRLFSLAIDNKFNRGRKTEYVIASCLYLQCRLASDAHMLIDFSERLAINVYELGSTYLKLRSTLHMDIDILPMVDPAIYNLRFANQLDFGREDTRLVAEDASRLVRRFKADWMTQGRRPAGICGACLIIAGRMSNYLRTPEEVAQVVKVSPMTIKKRLVEFGRTKGANLTVEEWRKLSQEDLDIGTEGELPPIMKHHRAMALKAEAKRERSESRLREGSEDDCDEESPRKKRWKDKGKEKELDINGVVAAVTEGIEVDGEQVEEDDNMPPLEAEDYASQLATLDMTPAEAKAAKQKARQAALRSAKSNTAGDELGDEELAELAQVIVDAEKRENDGQLDEKGDDDPPLQEIDEKEQGMPKLELPKFDRWDDTEAVYRHLEERYLSDKTIHWKGDDLRPKVILWIKGRDPKQVIEEIEAVERARLHREKEARAKPEHVFEDLDDDELDAYWIMGEDERQARARMWLSHNGTWLEQEKERQEKKAAYNKAHGIDPNKPKPKRKRHNNPHRGPYKSAEAAIESFKASKKITSRINFAALSKLGISMDDDKPGVGGSGLSGLMRMDDDDEKEDDKDDDDLYGDEEDDDLNDQNPIDYE